MSLKKNFAWLLFARAISMLCVFMTGMIINRALGPYYRGIFAEIQTWIGLFVVLFGLSLDSVIYHYSNKNKFGSDDKARFAVNTLLSLMLALLAAICLTSYVLLKPEGFSKAASSFLGIIDAIIIFTMVTANWTIFLQSLNQIKLSAIALAVPSIVNLMILFIAFRFHSLDVGLTLLATLFVQVLGSLILFLMFFKLGLLQLSFSLPVAIDMVKSGLKQHGATVATFLYTKINQLILFKYCGEEKTGFFSMALTLAMSAMVIPMTLQNVLYPRIIHANDELQVTFKSLRVVFYGWGAIIIAILFFAKPIIILYGGSEYLPAVNDFRVLSVAFWFLALSSIVAPYLIKLGAFLLCSLSAVLLGVFSVTLNYYLIPKYATTGAAFATASTCFAGFCMVIAMVRYLSGQNPFRFLGVINGSK